MKSPYGRRGQICAHFHWSWWYVNHEISYAEICRIMADLPQYDYDKKDSESKSGKPIKLTDKNATEVAEIINKMLR